MRGPEKPRTYRTVIVSQRAALVSRLTHYIHDTIMECVARLRHVTTATGVKRYTGFQLENRETQTKRLPPDLKYRSIQTSAFTRPGMPEASNFVKAQKFNVVHVERQRRSLKFSLELRHVSTWCPEA